MNCVSDFFTYETTKSVVVKSWTIGVINRAVQLLIISYFVGWVFLHEKAYQVRDTAIESSVVTKVKGFGRYANRVMDVSDYVTPPQGTSVFVIITKMIVTENQMQGFCPESEEKYRCVSDSQCGPERFPSGGILTGRCVNYSSVLRTCEIQGWCPTEVDTVEMPVMMEAENFTIFIKNSIRFPLFNFEKGNLLPNLTAADMKTCRFHPDKAPFCPILRVGDVVKFAGQDFAKLASTGGVLGIKIGWVCDLDRAWDQCIPKYSFTRLDSVSEKSSVSPGYNFRFAKYYKLENGSEYRTLLKAFGIRFDVLVYGNGTVLCDIILLNFLKGADQYKAKKFEEVSWGGWGQANERWRDRAGSGTRPQGLSIAPPFGDFFRGAHWASVQVGGPEKRDLAKMGSVETLGGSVGHHCRHPHLLIAPLRFWLAQVPVCPWGARKDCWDHADLLELLDKEAVSPTCCVCQVGSPQEDLPRS
uniref:P2X purinoceptor n=2 Tax=Felis catus TaxID=9685 RepID=A0ABI7YK32_FELCA